MSRLNTNQGLMPSILDRLIDAESEGTSWLRGYTPRQMLEAVRRDLEDLFNTHQSASRVPAGYTEVASSIVSYGLPDLASIYTVAKGKGQDVAMLIAEVVARNEPRLRDIRVVLLGMPNKEERRVRFHIEANLNVDPSPEVAFETVLELATGQTSIRTDEA
jgi:type VI secretion system protein ImpF